MLQEIGWEAFYWEENSSELISKLIKSKPELISVSEKKNLWSINGFKRDASKSSLHLFKSIKMGSICSVYDLSNVAYN